MATNKWTGGANDGNWNTAGNWSLAAVPVNTNDVVIDVTNQSITAGLNQTGVALASLTVTSGVNIGGNGSSLVIGVTGTAKFAGTGTVYISADTGVQAIVKAVVQSTAGQTVYLTGGTVTTLEVARGATAYVQAACIVTTCNTAGGLTLDYNATGITTFEQAAGNCVSYRSIATGRVNGQGTTCTLVTAAAISTAMTVTGAAQYFHRSSGTIAAITVQPGSSASSEGSTYGSFTVTNSTRWYGATLFDTEEEVATVTYTNSTAKVAYT